MSKYIDRAEIGDFQNDEKMQRLPALVAEKRTDRKVRALGAEDAQERNADDELLPRQPDGV